MTILIKISSVSKHHPFLTHEWGGKTFNFIWNPKYEAYVYEPKSQLEFDLIFGTPRQFCPWTFVPIVLPAQDTKELDEARATIVKLQAELKKLKEGKPARQPKPSAPQSVQAQTAELVDV